MNQGYGLFFKFIETFAPSRFQNIDPNHPLITELEEMMKFNGQFFFVADVIEIKILFTSKLSVQMIGVEPECLTPYHFIEATHPKDIKRHSKARAKLFKLASDLFIEEEGETLFASNLIIRNAMGDYTDLLFQCYLFYSEIPHKTVYEIQVHTEVGWCKRIKNGFYYYVGNDMSYFKYPDEKLMNTGICFTKRELEIIRLIEFGLRSEQIAEKLFLSKYTVNTHRRNVVKKSGKANMMELIFDLTEKGIL
jgi:hypothetical protein